MGVKPDRWIIRNALENGMIEPFQETQVSQGAISFGVSSYGYDFRLGNRFKLYRGATGGVLDPKSLHADAFDDFEGDQCLIPAGSFLLAESLEYFRIPRDVLTLCQGKSTYARCGVLVNVTPFEPEWQGHVTMSLANTAPDPVRLYAGEGIAQVIFLAADGVCETSYGDRQGKYQKQTGIVLPKVKGTGKEAEPAGD